MRRGGGGRHYLLPYYREQPACNRFRANSGGVGEQGSRGVQQYMVAGVTPPLPLLSSWPGKEPWQARPAVILSAAKNLRFFATQRRSFAALWMTAAPPGPAKRTCHTLSSWPLVAGPSGVLEWPTIEIVAGHTRNHPIRIGRKSSV